MARWWPAPRGQRSGDRRKRYNISNGLLAADTNSLSLPRKRESNFGLAPAPVEESWIPAFAGMTVWVSAWVPDARRDSRRSLGLSCDRAILPPHTSPAADTAGT